MNDLPDGIHQHVNFLLIILRFFSKVFDINKSANNVKTNLEQINQWDYQ